MHEAARCLFDLGFSDKEVNVYLAILELGTSSVQEIAKKAGVNRSTAYAIIKTLKERGLASESFTDGKTLFVAESPNRLCSLLDDEKEKMEKRKRTLNESIPYFMAMFNAMEHKPVVKFFEGEEGISAARDVLATAGLGHEYLSFTAIDEGTIRLSKINESQRLRMAKRMRGKCIITIKPDYVPPPFDHSNWEMRKLSYDDFPFTGEINITNGTVAAFAVNQIPIAFVVESKEMFDLFRAMFLAAWQAAEKIE